MSKQPNRYNSGWSAWSSVRKGQVVGAFLGALIAIGFYVYTTAHPVRFPSFGIILVLLVERVPIAIWDALGLKSADASGKLKYLFLCLLVTVNALEGLLLGTVVGLRRRPSMKD